MDPYGRRQPDEHRSLSQMLDRLLEDKDLLRYPYDPSYKFYRLQRMATSLFQQLPEAKYELDSIIEELKSKRSELNYYKNEALKLHNKTDLTAKPSGIVNYEREITRLKQEKRELADALRNKEKEHLNERPVNQLADRNLHLQESIDRVTQDNHRLRNLLQEEKEKSQNVPEKYKNNFSRWQQIIDTTRQEAQTAKDLSDSMVYENKRLRSTLLQEEEKAKRLEERLLSLLQTRQTDIRQHEGYKSYEDNRIERTDFDTSTRLKKQLEETRGQLKNAQKELQDAKTRLSRVMGDRLTDMNPSIADLSDRNRPTKIAERYQELYDNQWTDAFENVNRTFRNEDRTVSTLKTILLDVMEFCKEEVGRQWAQITYVFAKRMKLPTDATKQLKECRKMTAEVYGAQLLMEYLNSPAKEFTSIARQIPDFVKECVQICWLMVVQDPPLVFGPETGRHAWFNKDHYKTYTKSGDRVAFIVWPVLLLHKGGPVLTKGVAQGADLAHSYGPPMDANLKQKTNIVHPLQSYPPFGYPETL